MKQKIENALAVIHNAYITCSNKMYLGHSGGKDSCVIFHLAKQIDPEIMVIHTPKGLSHTHPDTADFLYYEVARHHIIHMVPKEHMDNFIIRNDLLLQIDGARRDECNRTERSDDFVMNEENVNRKDLPQFVEFGLFGIAQLYPIFDWTDDEVWKYIVDHKVQVSKEYLVK